MDLTAFKALSFDCYGTLIDWETGHRRGAVTVGARTRTLAVRRGTAARVRQAGGGRTGGDAVRAVPGRAGSAFRHTGFALGREVSDEWARRLGDIGAGLAGVPRLRGRVGAPGHPLPADHPVERAPRRVRGQQPAAARGLRGDHHGGGRRRVQARREPLPGAGSRAGRRSACSARSCCTWRRACSTTTFRPSGRGCRPCGSTGGSDRPGWGATPEPSGDFGYDLEFGSMGEFADAVDKAF